ncbi:SRPBCC family protein [Chitinophaga silvisoli]|uniref:SRPBCC domain-containing protein n=1 Tax=Chitinophaga silvisoli TaxID=2291814 RepID=A0A3E1NX79_9BACT|nr:SRPBCC domain-containing protein [Chitinophaga silvisoli]RFM32533.1 SRPBCC domain-containing protein [Chitinophaga silvisoli]
MLFNYTPDRGNNTLTIQREFLADHARLWDHYTRSELLEQWFAPPPMSTRTKSMDFREGGHWHYAMVEPNGTEYWGMTQYKTIHPIQELQYADAFCDEEGNINTDIPGADWTITFTDQGDRTLVQSVLTFKSLADLEQILEMGMEDGMKATYETLDQLLA